MAEQMTTKLMGKICAVCLSTKKGTEKTPVAAVTCQIAHGILGDAHAGNWHRQISLLSQEDVMSFNERGAEVEAGAFGENLLVAGIDLKKLPLGTLLRSGSVVLRLTQIGKECHSHCNIYQRVGDCIMPRAGVFAEVLAGGTLRPGDQLLAELPATAALLRAAVITLSDKAFAGEREDSSGPRAAELLIAAGYSVEETVLLPDERELIERELIRLADVSQLDLIITTGGTGFSLRDCTPEATLAVATRNAPGIAEAIRVSSLQITPRAMLGRGASVLRNHTLIVNLPGSKKAVEESLSFILPVLPHGLEILRGTASECARQDGENK